MATTTQVFLGLSSGDEYVGSAEDESSADADADVALIVFALIICVFGIIGNLLVIFVILVLREYKKAVTHWYVLQLAIADMLFLCTIPFKIAEDIHDEWTFAEGVCKFKEAVLFFNYYSSILFLTVMGIDRYIAVCHGFSTGLQKLRTMRAAYVSTAFVWVTSFLLCIPILLYSHKMGFNPHCKCMYDFPDNKQPEPCTNEKGAAYSECMDTIQVALSEGWCTDLPDGSLGSGYYVTVDASGVNATMAATTIWQDDADGVDSYAYDPTCTYQHGSPGWKAFISFNFVVMFTLPLIIMSVCYTFIILRVRKPHIEPGESGAEQAAAAKSSRKSKRQRSTSAAAIKAEKTRSRVTIMCGALVILFLICWLPFHTVHLAKMLGIKGTGDYCLKLMAVASLLAYVNSALNPYLYNFIGRKFKKRLRSAVGSVRRSVEKSTTSLSGSGATVRYRAKKKSDRGTSSSDNTGTVITKIYRGKHGNQPESSSGHDASGVKESSEQQPLVEFKISSSPEKTLEKD